MRSRKTIIEVHAVSLFLVSLLILSGTYAPEIRAQDGNDPADDEAGAAEAAPEPVTFDARRGVWRHPDRDLWISIHEDSSAVKCRIEDDEVVRTTGSLGENDSLEWENIWGPDEVSLIDGKLFIKGDEKIFLERTDRMDYRCYTPTPLPDPLEIIDQSGGFGTGRGVGSGTGGGIGTGSGEGSGGGIGTGRGSGSGIGTGGGTGTGSGGKNMDPPPAVKGENRPLRVLSKPAPSYTKSARRNNVSGVVMLRVTFKASGEIGKVSVISGLTHGLTEQAVAAVRRVRFEPEIRNGKPVDVTKRIIYTFSIY